MLLYVGTTIRTSTTQQHKTPAENNIVVAYFCSLVRPASARTVMMMMINSVFVDIKDITKQLFRCDSNTLFWYMWRIQSQRVSASKSAPPRVESLFTVCNYCQARIEKLTLKSH